MTRARNDIERAAHARYRRRRRKLITLGQWHPFMDAQPVREHVLAIRDAGLSPRELESVLGLTRDTFRYMLWGTSGHPPAQKIRREVAEMVLSFWPTLADFPDTARIDPTGTRRRVDALMTLGWTRKAMADALGMLHTSLNRALLGERITARIARAIAALYDQWWNQRPEHHGVLPQYAERTRRIAVEKGLMSPLAWDDDTIDDPNAVPMLDAETPTPEADPETSAARWLAGESVVLGDAARRLVIRHLMEWSTDPVETIAARLEMSPATLSRSWERIKKRERDAGRKPPWRRAYLTAQELGLETEMTSNEMERAA